MQLPHLFIFILNQLIELVMFDSSGVFFKKYLKYIDFTPLL